jgi:hypothetical protein
MLAAVRPGPVFPDPAPPRFYPEKGVFGRYRLYSFVVGQIVVPAAGRFVRHSVWGHFVSCLDRQSLELSSSWMFEAPLVCLQCTRP